MIENNGTIQNQFHTIRKICTPSFLANLFYFQIVIHLFWTDSWTISSISNSFPREFNVCWSNWLKSMCFIVMLKFLFCLLKCFMPSKVWIVPSHLTCSITSLAFFFQNLSKSSLLYKEKDDFKSKLIDNNNLYWILILGTNRTFKIKKSDLNKIK